ncbi:MULTISPECIES: Mov34/MPN/PAD-1 family protein [unclassified Burkholderia]|uniref:Mov34/MPN/PAD-1 family protein n=1 Tax=unclassified Burkholderia TaxID=2613784 RepID=UPI002AB2F09D|nr:MULTISPECIES: Mov34/MPN/PAD-1 family protein [unclassified Burkholderia]
MSCRTFFSHDKARYVLFTESVLQHMYGYAQRARHQTEAGGELFSPSPYSASLLVDAIAGPHPGDRRSRCACNPDVQATTQARNTQYACGRHAVGLWHTHPEARPSPSGRDRATTEDYLRAFNEDRERYLTVILGNRGDTPALTVWSAEKCGSWQRWTEFRGQPSELPLATLSMR